MSDKADKCVLSVDGDRQLEFVRIPLRFDTAIQADVFAQKNNKTLEQTLDHRRYAGLAKSMSVKYPSGFTTALGTFLYDLKCGGDVTYRRFLNKYGDLAYSNFAIADERYLSARGVYAYFVGEDLKYIGRCRDSLRKRINQGYGKIHPKNCYIDGQATNCHLNALITHVRDDVSLWFCAISSDADITETELKLLRRHAPAWNLQLPN